MFNNRAEARQRFSLRKLTVGVVSVLLGLTFLTYNGENVHADTNSASAQPKTEEVSSSSSKGDIDKESTVDSNNVKQEKTPVESTNVKTKNAAPKAEVKSSTTQVAGKASAAQDANKTEDKISNSSQQEKTGEKNQTIPTSGSGEVIGQKTFEQEKQEMKAMADAWAATQKAEHEKELADWQKKFPGVDISTWAKGTDQGNRETADRIVNPPIPRSVMEDVFNLNSPDLSPNELAKLGLNKDTFYYVDPNNGQKMKVKANQCYLVVDSEDGRQQQEFIFTPTHATDGTINLHELDGSKEVSALNHDFFFDHSWQAIEIVPATEGKHIYVNVNHQLDSNDAQRAIINNHSEDYSGQGQWITKEVDTTKPGDYQGYFEATYKNGISVLTGVPVTVVDLKGATITGTLGTDILHKVEEVDHNPEKYVTGQPEGAKFGKFQRPDISKVTTKDNPAIGTVQITYPDGNTGIARIHFIINSPVTYKDIGVTETRTVKFGYYKNGTNNPNDWVTLAPDVVQTKTLYYKASVDTNGVLHFISWEPNQDATLAAVPWAKIAGWVPRFGVLDPHSSKDNAAIKQALIDFHETTNIISRSDIVRCTYIRESTKDVDTGETKAFIRRVHFGYYDKNHKWNELTQPEIEVLSFHHHILVNQYGDQVKDDGYKPVTAQTFEAVPWKVIEGWTKAGTDNNAADAYTVSLDDIANKPENQLVLDIYAPYTKNAQPTTPGNQPTSPVQPTKPTSPTQPTNQPSQPTNVPPHPENPTKPVEPTKPNQPSNVRPKPVKPIRPAKPQSSNVKPKPVKPAKARNTKPIAQNGKKNDHHYGYRYVPKATSSKSYSGVSNASALKACNKVLPHTGNKGSGVIAVIGAAFAAVAGFFGLAGRRRKRF